MNPLPLKDAISIPVLRRLLAVGVLTADEESRMQARYRAVGDALVVQDGRLVVRRPSSDLTADWKEESLLSVDQTVH